MAFLEMSFDVFYGHSGVVHQNSDSERQTTERHHIDRFAKKAEDHDRRQDRQGNRDRDDQGAPPAPQEQQNHQAGETCGDDRLADHTANCAAYEDGLISKRHNFQFRRQCLCHTRKKTANAFHNIDRRSVAGLKNADQGSAVAILAHDVGLWGKAVADIGYVAKIDRGIPNRLDG